MSKELEENVQEEEYILEGKEKDLTTELEKKIDDLKNKNLLLLSEIENQRKKNQRQIDDIYKYGNKKLLLAVLNFLVDLEERALKVMREDSDKKVKNHLFGLEMMRENLWKILEKEGIREIKIELNKGLFNSRFHEVIEEISNDELPEGTILEVISKGYLLHDQLLKSSKVKVTKQNLI
jgi:molecular chaperone GrpE